MSSGRRYPGQVDAAFPEVFTEPPPPPATNKPGQLSQQQVQQFFQDGFVLVEDYLTAAELEPCKAAMADQVDRLADRLHRHGKIKNLYKEYGLFQRLTMIEKEFPDASVILHKCATLDQAFRDLWTNERLLNVAEQLLGSSDIAGHPVWNLRTKTPKNRATVVPWHQDSAYLDTSSYNVMQLTAWIPMLNSNAANGCMEVVRGGHKSGRVATHTCCWKDTHYVMLDEDEMKTTLGADPASNTVLCEVPYGGVLFFANTIPHRSLANTSNDVRWSLDLRWQRAEFPVGFYGMKFGTRFRSSTDPDYRINWSHYDTDDRFKLIRDEDMDANFDPVMAGWWMNQWEITHHNKHTAGLPNLPPPNPITEHIVY